MTLAKVLLLLALATSTQVFAQEIEVSKIEISDPSGALVDQFASTIAARSIVLIVDAKRSASQTLIGKLKTAKLDWRDRLIIIVSGTSDELKVTRANAALTGVRWFSTPGGVAHSAFKVAGIPFAVGLSPSGITAWKIIGEAAITDNDLSKLKSWAALAATKP